MLSKEECEQALMNICSSNSKIEDRKVFKDLINEHFGPRPYKFEDLKNCDCVYDKKEKEIVLIIETLENRITNQKIIRALVFGYKDSYEIPFEENRFYPVQIVNVRCE